MSQEDHDDYIAGHGAGEKVRQETGWMEIAERKMRELTITNSYSGKSQAWWRGFHDGKKNKWNPPPRH